MACMRTTAIETELQQARTRGPLREIKIPPCPELLARLRVVLQQPGEPDLAEVQAIASADVAMSATLIRVANSPVHLGDGQPCATVGQALTRLGLEPSAALMTGFLVRHAIPVKSPQLQRFWERSHKRSLAMAHLARQIPGLDAGLAASHGLFCHVGMPVLLQSVRGYGATMVEAAARIDRSYVATEDANHRTNHAVVGALTVRAWGLPPAADGLGAPAPRFPTCCANARPTLRWCCWWPTGLLAEQLMRQHERLPADADWVAHGAEALDWLQVSGRGPRGLG